MKQLLSLYILLVLVTACSQSESPKKSSPVNWSARSVDMPFSAMVSGQTYLSVYPEVYHLKEGRTHDLTATVSMRNPNPKDTIYIRSAQYFNTQGEEIRSYLDKPIYIAPLETVQIVIEENDKEGGAGASFLFGWSIKPNSTEPLFEGVMISTSGQQGLSFKTKGIRVD
jgi:hypothetical protein